MIQRLCSSTPQGQDSSTGSLLDGLIYMLRSCHTGPGNPFDREEPDLILISIFSVFKWKTLKKDLPALSLQDPFSSFCSQWNFQVHSVKRSSLFYVTWSKKQHAHTTRKTLCTKWATIASICSRILMNCSAAIFTLWSSLPNASAWRSLARKPCGRNRNGSDSKTLTETNQCTNILHVKKNQTI